MIFAMRNYIYCYINGVAHKLSPEQSFMTVGEYLRYIKGLTGTKIVCSEGDCGACTILVSRMISGKMSPYRSINSCISFMYLLDRCHLITVEGLEKNNQLHEVQTKMIECHGAQCGYCTPGIICAMANMTEDLKISGKKITPKKVKNYLTGNLCRCTGYKSIIEAGQKINLAEVDLLGSYYDDTKILNDFLTKAQESVLIKSKLKEVYLPTQFREMITYKYENKNCSITSGGTDLGVLHNKGKLNQTKILSLNNLAEAYEIAQTDKTIEIGAKASLSDVEKMSEKYFPAFARMLQIFASPQIKNNGTLVGNIVNASPIGDSIPFLMTAEAELILVSSGGMRFLNINHFYKDGYKNLDLLEHELVYKVSIPKTTNEFKIYKVSVRKDLDISTVSIAFSYKLNGAKIENIKIAIGGVGPKALRTLILEKELIGKDFEKDLFMKSKEMILNEISPLSDHRGSLEFRKKLTQNLFMKFYDEVSKEKGLVKLPEVNV